MKFSAIAAASLVALTSFAGTASAAASCSLYTKWVTRFYEIEIEGVDNIPGLCGGLWDNLKGFPGCTVSRPNGCEARGASDKLFMYFSTSLACNKGAVQAAFWEATKNKWGSISC
ncbi:hypothetical protein EsH8_I_000332 [Colletotrichum jinshuiense]